MYDVCQMKVGSVGDILCIDIVMVVSTLILMIETVEVLEPQIKPFLKEKYR